MVYWLIINYVVLYKLILCSENKLFMIFMMNFKVEENFRNPHGYCQLMLDSDVEN